MICIYIYMCMYIYMYTHVYTQYTVDNTYRDSFPVFKHIDITNVFFDQHRAVTTGGLRVQLFGFWTAMGREYLHSDHVLWPTRKSVPSDIPRQKIPLSVEAHSPIFRYSHQIFPYLPPIFLGPFFMAQFLLATAIRRWRSCWTSTTR